MIRRVAALLVLTACTEHIQLAHDPLAGLVGFDIAPAQATIVITDLSQPPQSFDFVATGHFAHGKTADITALVAWSIDNAYPGDFAAPGQYETSNDAAGHVMVTATGPDGAVATAALDVIVNATVVDPAFPPPAPGVFQPGAPIITGDPTRSPALLYPASETRFPQGVATTLFQLSAGTGNDEAALAFDCADLHLGVITGGDRWLASDRTQRMLAQSCIGDNITVTLAAAASATGTIYGAPPATIAFSPDRPDGVIYYWSAATSGIMRGELAATTASKLYPTDATCAGCHSARRDGSALAMGYGGETLQTISLPQLAPVIPATAKLPMGWASFSPDGTRVVVANKGVLTLYDAATGKPVGAGGGRVPLPAMQLATHPDWSPDGSYVAIAMTAMTPDNMNVDKASIARVPFRNGTWGPAEVLVASAGAGDNNYFPRYSPDGGYLAYVHAATASHGASSAELRLVPAAGGTPIALPRASRRVGPLDGVADAADTMPSWAPASGDRAWLAFASSRAYGIVLPTAGRPQIWIAAIDLKSPESDPSSSAFWLPCQDVTVLENNPVWAPFLQP